MPTSIRPAAAARQAPVDDRDVASRSTLVDHALVVLRGCVSECGWTYDALAAHLQKDKSYIHRVLSGEKPMTLDFLIALPDDIEALWHERAAEAFGRIVVTPSMGDDAVRHFVSGLFGMFAPQLPLRASHMAHAELATAARKVAR